VPCQLGRQSVRFTAPAPVAAAYGARGVDAPRFAKAQPISHGHHSQPGRALQHPAQKARGADFDTGNLLQKAKALVPLLVPLFISAFRRADELAIAMECRCYHGGEGRTRLRQLKLKGIDIAALVFAVLLCVGIGVLRHFGL